MREIINTIQIRAEHNLRFIFAYFFVLPDENVKIS